MHKLFPMCNLINLVNNSLIQAVQTDQDIYLIFVKVSELASTGMKIKAPPNQTMQTSYLLCESNILLIKALL